MDERTVFEPRARIRAGPGTRLNDLYEIDSLIGVGGMGEVFRGHVIETGDPVAIKTIRPDFAGHATALALFRKEAAALHTVHHGAVVRYYVFSIDRVLGLPYLAMEYVTGESLAERISRGPLEFEAVEILRRRLAGGLQAAHEVGIIHRDVSPDNVILPGGDPARAKLIDFGIAHSLTGQTVIGDGFAGKYNYVSPEQLGLQGGIVTGRSDIFSLGLVLAEASRGRPLDMGASPAEVIERRSAVPDLTGVDARLVPLLTSMLQPDPQRRAGSMAEVEAWRPPAARSEPAERATGGRRWRLLAAGSAAGLLVLAGATVFALLPPARQPVTAPENGDTLSERPGRTPGMAPELRPDAPVPPDVKPGGDAERAEKAPDPARPDLPPRQEVSPRQGTPDRPDTPSRVPKLPDSQARPDVPEKPVLQDQSTARERTTTSAGPDRPTATPPVAQRPPGTDPFVSFIRDFQGGPCFLLIPTVTNSQAVQVEGYGVDAQPFMAFDAAFKKRFNFEAQIQLRQIERGQCPVIEAIEALAAQGREAVGSPQLKLDDDRIRSGGELRGSIDLGSARSVRLLLVEGDGVTHDLEPYLKRTERQASFAIRLEKPPRVGSQSQLLVAVTSSEPLVLNEAGRRSDAIFRAIAREAARQGSGVGLAVRAVKVGS